MSESPLHELIVVVQRDLGADAVHVHDADDEPAPDGRSLRCDLPGGRRLVATFAELPADADARRRRLDMLVAAFSDTLAQSDRRASSRPPPGRSLDEELAAVAQRVNAVEAVVIDARSPVIWGSAGEQPQRPREIADAVERLRAPGALHAVGPNEGDAARYGIASAEGLRVDPRAIERVPRAVCARHRAVPVAEIGGTLVVAMADPQDVDAIAALTLASGLTIEPLLAGGSTAAFLSHMDEDGGDDAYAAAIAAIPDDERARREDEARRARDAWYRYLLSRRAIDDVRALSEMDDLHRGGHLRHAAWGGGLGVVARSFASIYLVILVFDAPFDELLVKRALTHALPTIERLVLALPPLDPPPRIGGVAAMRPRRRR